MNFLVKLLSCGLGTGFSPVAPGSAGSALAAGFILLAASWWSPPAALGISAATFLLGVYCTTRVEKYWGHDSRKMVIDEIAGMFLAASFIEINLYQVGAAFVIFRILDIIKPPPAAWAEKLPSGWGVMTDDLVAGAYTVLILWGLNRWM